jgi:hypothetical protein
MLEECCGIFGDQGYVNLIKNSSSFFFLLVHVLVHPLFGPEQNGNMGSFVSTDNSIECIVVVITRNLGWEDIILVLHNRPNSLAQSS